MTQAMKRSGIHRFGMIYLIMLPGFLYIILFRLIPLWGNLFAFMEYNTVRGIFHSRWVGFKHFIRLFTYPDLWMLIRNTFVISLMRLVWGFPMPIILSLFLNDLGRPVLKRILQSLIYLPHFISWVVVASITMQILKPGGGLVNSIITSLGGSEIFFMTEPDFFRPLLVIQGIWKEAGWGTVMYLAALAGVDPNLYEAAEIDGCSKFQRTLFISLPAIKGTAIILFLLAIGRLINENFQQIFLMMNPLVQEKGEVFETYTFYLGIIGGRFGYTTAVGLFKSIVAFTMVVAANKVIRLMGERGIY